jgi:predicted nucleic acid-binding protein
MRILVDTSIWSVVLRSEHNPKISAHLAELIRDGRVEIIGPIRQEILSGIRSEKQFEKLQRYLQAFPDIPLSTEDYVLAAQGFNQCRSKGIQGSHIDFLLCAAAQNHNLSIYTLDKDFGLYAAVIPILLYKFDSH